jgi:hypothetical protein
MGVGKDESVYSTGRRSRGKSAQAGFHARTKSRPMLRVL